MRQLSPAWPRNRGPIRSAVRELLAGTSSLLEVASGPGQHAFDHADVLDAQVFPTDLDPQALASIEAWRTQQADPRVQPPRRLNVADPSSWPTGPFDAQLAINFLHMVDLPTCEQFFTLAGTVVGEGGRVAVYECFTFGGEHTSESNAAFDARLRPRGGGVHPIEAMDAYAAAAGFPERTMRELPANNLFVVWSREPLTNAG